MKKLIPLVLAFVLALSACGGSAAPAETAAPKMSLDEVQERFESAMAATFNDDDDHYSVSLQDNVFLLNTWYDGVANDALKAKEDAEYKASWDSMAQSFVNAQASFQKFLDENGYSDYIAMLNVMNDQNTEMMLLSVAKGQVVFDEVNGINKLS